MLTTASSLATPPQTVVAPSAIRVLLADPQSLIREGLRCVLTQTPQFSIVGEARDGPEAIAQACRLQPDVLLMDLRMPLVDGATAAETITQQHPHIRILMLTVDGKDAHIAQAFKAGASGYLLKNTPPDELIQAVHLTSKGYIQLGPGLGKRLLAELHMPQTREPLAWKNLTSREQEIARMIGMGLNNGEIAQQLCISKSTVKNHITKILQRLNLRDRTQVAILTHAL